MKVNTLLACFTLSLVAVPALAAAAANNCTSQSTKLKSSERSAFMKSCLAQLNSPSSVKEKEQQNKKALCEQNAKNRNLQGNEKSNYLATCMNVNEAQAVASKAPVKPAAKISSAKTKKPAVTKTVAKGDTARHKKATKKQQPKASSQAAE